MRKGFSLVELLAVVVALPFVFLLLDGLFKTFIAEIPWSCRIANEHTSLLYMMDQMQKDIDRAKNLLESYAGRTSNDRQVLIALPEGIFCYRLENGRVLREKLTDAGQSDAEQPTVWSLPHANIQWKVWAENGRGYAVETNTSIEYKRRGQWKNKMAHTYLYCAGAIGKEL
jgi:hypothetical protein